jgi:copper chaperone CopZ
MKSKINILIAIICMLSMTISSRAQFKNASTETVKIYGNCEMCKATIEKAGNLSKIAKVDWNIESKMATITYNSKKSNANEILKRIAQAGYDSDSFLAPDAAYDHLPGCCKYIRSAKIMPLPVPTAIETPMLETAKVELPPAEHQMPMEVKSDDHTAHAMPTEAKAPHEQIITNEAALEKTTAAKKEEHAGHTMPQASKADKVPTTANKTKEKPQMQKEADQMQAVFASYFDVKNALVNSDSKAAALKATLLAAKLNAIKMNDLAMDVHMVWMKVMKELGTDSKRIADSKKIDEQRKTLIPLTKNIYALMKVAKTETPTYYQFCPMANGGKGANWLSKEKEVENPYYGSEMMNCGKVVETIK